MRLSEAMRLGAMATRQAFGTLAEYGGPDGLTVVATCALGAAHFANGTYGAIGAESRDAELMWIQLFETQEAALAPDSSQEVQPEAVLCGF